MALQRTYEEGALVAEIKRKNQTAFNALYEKYSPALYTVVLQIVQSKESADHLIKKVFQVIWQTFEAYDPAREKLFTWLLHTTRKVVLEQLQSMNSRDDIKHSFSENGSLLVKDPLIDNCGLKEIINKLTHEQRILLNLYYYGGLNVSQIAHKMAIPEEEVTIKIKTALSELGILIRLK